MTATANQRIENREIADAVDRIADAVASRHSSTEALYVVSVAEGGLELGRRLAAAVARRLERDIQSGVVNIAFHRDDIASKPIPKIFIRTDLPFDVDEATIIIADDVLFSGRTVRAALNEIFDQGRPERVELAVLCDRGNRKLPIQADYVGLTFETSPGQNVEAFLSPDNPSDDYLSIHSP